jgi:WD40 repeat protein
VNDRFIPIRKYTNYLSQTFFTSDAETDYQKDLKTVLNLTFPAGGLPSFAKKKTVVSFKKPKVIKELSSGKTQDFDYYSHLLIWPEPNFLVAAHKNELQFYKLTDSVVTSYKISEDKISLIFENNGKYCVCANQQVGILDFFAVDQTQNLEIGKICVSSCNIKSKSCSLIGTRIGSIELIDLRLGKIQTIHEDPIDNSTVCAISPCPSGNEVLCGRNSDQIYIFDIRKMDSPVAKIEHHKSAIRALQWQDSRYFYSGGGNSDKTLCKWDVADTDKPIKTFFIGCQILDIHLLQNKNMAITTGLGNSGVSFLNEKHNTKFHQKSYHTGYPLYSVLSSDKNELAILDEKGKLVILKV